MTPSGNEPATFQLVAQCVNKLRHNLPPLWGYYVYVLQCCTLVCRFVMF